MPAKRIKQLVLDLSFEHKMLGIGLVLLLVSLFLPWYQDLDLFKTGDMFLGITGPMYFVGYSILLIVLLNLTLLVSAALNVKLPFNVRPSSIYLASGIVIFYLLLLTNSVYFHQKFGVNILNKESPFGMFIAFISASLITIGGYISTRDKQSLLKEFQEQTQEPLIKLNEQMEQRKPKESLRVVHPMPEVRKAPAVQTVPAEQATKHETTTVFKPASVLRPDSSTSVRKSAGMNMVQRALIDAAKTPAKGDAARVSCGISSNAEPDMVRVPAGANIARPDEGDVLPKKQPQPYRMDL
jgi:hypothetical protein